MALIGAGIVLVLFGFIKLSLQNKTLIQIVFISFLLVFLSYLLYSLYSPVIAAAGFVFLMLLFTYIIGKQVTPKNEQNEESFRPSSSTNVVERVAKRPTKADMKVKEAVQPEINTNTENDMPSEVVASEMVTNVVDTSEIESSTSSGALLQQDAIDELIRQATGEQTQNEETEEVVEEKSILELEIEQENELDSSSDVSGAVVIAQEPVVVEEEQEEEEDLFSSSDAPLSQEMIDRLFAEFEQNNVIEEDETEIAASLEVIDEVADEKVEVAEVTAVEEVEVTEEVNQEEIFYQRPKRMLAEDSDKKEEGEEEPTLLSRRPSAIQEEPMVASSEEPDSYDEEMTYGRQAQEDFWNELKGTKKEQTSNRSKLFDELEENIFEDQK